MTLIAGTTIVGLSAWLLYIVEFAWIARIDKTTPMARMSKRKDGR